MANRGATWDSDVHTIADLKELGSKKLPKMYRDYFNEGAMDLVTLQDNEAAYNRYKIIRGFCIFGVKTSFPLGFSPAAMHGLAHPDGELATSRAAAKMGVCMGLWSYATESLENVAAQGNGDSYAMQLCILRDRPTMLQILERAEAAGYKAIFLSVDTPCLGRRLNEYGNNFTPPDDMSWPNLLSDGKSELSGGGRNPDAPSKHDFGTIPSLDWDSAIPWLRQHTKLQLWLNGVYSAEDVALAIRHKLDGVVISNHGGRQLDGVPATLDSLRVCAPVAAGKIPLVIDGGIRRGSDIFKALALGASHCFVGLAYRGQEGVELSLKILMYEFKITMALAGCQSIKEINPGHVTYLNSRVILARL